MKAYHNDDVNIYTLSKYADKCTIFVNDQWFNKVRSDWAFLEKHANIIYTVDKAKLKKEEYMSIITPFGVGNTGNLSTGCKTLLNIVYLLEKHADMASLVNITEAGDAVVDRIFETVAGSNVSLYLRRSVCPSNMRLNYIINGVPVADEFEFLEAIVLEEA